MQFIAVLHTQPPHKLLTLCGRTIVGGSHDIVTSIFANNGCRWVHHVLPTFHCHYIIQDARSRIVDAPLTLILGHGNDLVVSIFAYKGGP